MSLLPAKLFTKSLTKMTLHERFTAYREQASTASVAIRDRILQQRQASAENRRLALQMANRPSVIAALKLKKKSVEQRLGQKRTPQRGTSVKSRLNLNFRTPGKVQTRLGPRRGRGVGRGGLNRASGSGFAKPGTSPMLKARLGIPRGSSNKFNNKRGNRKRVFFNQQRTNTVQKFNRAGGRGRGGSVRKGRGGGNRGRGGSWENRTRALPSKDKLDEELDQYMAQTKTDRYIHF